MAALCERLGNPQENLPPVIHVAGTNGKGSVIAFLRAMLEASGLKVHVYTSPHLFEFNERVALAGEKVSDGALFAALEETRLAAEGLQYTFFEATTAAALLLFSRFPADALIVECGMGGWLDATNIIDNKALAVITSISLDHQRFLGGNLKAVAVHKAGIMRAGVAAITAPEPEEVRETLQEVAEKLGAKLETAPIFDGAKWPAPSLQGAYQLENAAVAIAAALKLGLSESAVAKGISTASWPGRMEKVDGLMGETWELWFDGAHNDAGAMALSSLCEGGVLVLGMSRGRNVKSFLAAFKGRVKFACAIKVKSEPNAYNAEEIVSVMRESGFECAAFDGLAEAFAFLEENFSGGKAVICGSLFLAGDIRECYKLRHV